MELPIIIELLIAVLLGAFIGIERETAPRQESSEEIKYEFVAGVRTHALIALLGGILGLILKTAFFPVAWIILGGFMGIFIISYAFMSFRVKAPGITSELAILFTLLTGLMITLNLLPLHIIVSLIIILSLILSKKESIHHWLQSIHRREIYALVSFAIISLVILPFLPQQTYSLGEVKFFGNIVSAYGISHGGWMDIKLINPFTLWLVVVLICGVNLAGHLLNKFFEQKNAWLFASVAGGFVSSTATTITLAQKSKGATPSLTNALAAGTIASTLASFITLPIIISPFSMVFLIKATLLLLPMFVAGLAAILLILYYARLRQNTKELETINVDSLVKSKEGEKIFSFESALKFALFLFGVVIITRFALYFFGKSAFVISSLIAAFAGVDPVAINLASMSNNLISLNMALFVFLAVNGINFLAKSIYCFYFGGRKFATKVSVVFAIMFAIGIVFLTW